MKMTAAAAAFVAVLVLAGQAAGAPSNRLSELPRAPKQQAPPSLACPTGAKHCLSYAGFIAWAGRDVSVFWDREFATARFRWTATRQVEVGPSQRASTRCTSLSNTVTSTTGPFYCSADGRFGTVFLPLLAIEHLVFPHHSTYKQHAFALSYVVAHEWAHHVQQLLGLLAGRPSLLTELQADCLAGVWGSSVYTRGLIGQADMDKTLELATLIGDAPGTPADAPTAHGTGAQRVASFLSGFRSGRPGTCGTW
jgi:uncharacterized protein